MSCDCPSEASLARIDRLVTRLDWLCLLTILLPLRPQQDLDALMEQAVDVQVDAHMRRHLCPIHGKILQQLTAKVAP